MTDRAIQIRSVPLGLLTMLFAFALLGAACTQNDGGAEHNARVNGDSRQAAAIVPAAQDPEKYAEVAREQYRSGEFLLSAESYARASVLDPENPRFHNDAGYAFWKCKDFENARKHLETAVGLSPKNLLYANNLAIVYVDIQRDNDALFILKSAHQDDAVANYNLGYIYLKRKRRDEAINQMEAAISLNPDLELAILWLGRLQLEVEPDELKAVYLNP